MHHYLNAITDTKGNALIGYFVRCVDTTTGSGATLYADVSLTPIISVSGVADAAKVNSDGNVDFYVAPGTYHLDIYATDATTFVRRIANVPLVDDNTLRSDLAADTGASLVTLSSGSTVERAIIENAVSLAQYWQRGSSAPTSAANLTALNTALALAASLDKAIYIPAGDWYCDAGAQILTGLVPIICDGRVYTNTTGAFITMKAVGGGSAVADNFWIEGGQFYNLNGTQAQKNSAIIQFQSDGALILYPEFLYVHGHGFYQMFDNSAGHRTTGFGEEGLMNHGLVLGCVPHYYVTQNAKYCIRHRTGSGTGWKYVDCRDDLAAGSGTDPVGSEVTGYPAFVRIEGGAGYVLSDVLSNGEVIGLNSHMVSVDGNMTYNSNICVSAESQIDAQAKGALIYDPPNATQPAINNTLIPNNIGGNIDVAPNGTTLVGSRVYSQGFSHAYGGNYVTIGSGAVTQPICSVKPASTHTCEVAVWASGAVSGVADGLRKKLFTVRHDGTNVTATEQTNYAIKDPSGAGAGFFDFTAVVSGGVVTFNMTMTATGTGNKVALNYEVKGGAWEVHRLF